MLLAVPGEINIDNESSKTSTKLTVEVKGIGQYITCHVKFSRMIYRQSLDLTCTTPPLFMQVKDYPGLLRVIAWVINGVDLIVENAK